MQKLARLPAVNPTILQSVFSARSAKKRQMLSQPTAIQRSHQALVPDGIHAPKYAHVPQVGSDGAKLFPILVRNDIHSQRALEEAHILAASSRWGKASLFRL